MKIFISYRRADTQATAGRMAQFLDGIGAVDEVFLDVDDIGVGENFERRIERTLARASHVFVLIGPGWAGPAGASGRPRLFDADDVVRRETALALRGEAKLVPILVDEARMPRPAELPDDLKELPGVNAFSLRTSHFDEDMDDLLDGLLGKHAGRGSRWRLAPLTLSGIALRALAGLAAGAALLIALGVVNRSMDNGCYDLACTVRKNLGLDSDADALGLLWLTAIGVLALAALAPFLWRRLRQRRR